MRACPTYKKNPTNEQVTSNAFFVAESHSYKQREPSNENMKIFDKKLLAVEVAGGYIRAAVVTKKGKSF